MRSTGALDWSRGGLAEGLACYRREEFFEAHEHWEAEWLRASEPEKTFLQAAIQVTAAFHHLRRGNLRGTGSLLRAALRRLEGYPAVFGEVDVVHLREDLRQCLAGLEREDAACAVPAILG